MYLGRSHRRLLLHRLRRLPLPEVLEYRRILFRHARVVGDALAATTQIHARVVTLADLGTRLGMFSQLVQQVTIPRLSAFVRAYANPTLYQQNLPYS